MTEKDLIRELRYIYGFSFRVLDKKESGPITFKVMSAREINRMVKERNKREMIWKIKCRLHSYSRGK